VSNVRRASGTGGERRFRAPASLRWIALATLLGCSSPNAASQGESSAGGDLATSAGATSTGVTTAGATGTTGTVSTTGDPATTGGATTTSGAASGGVASSTGGASAGSGGSGGTGTTAAGLGGASTMGASSTTGGAGGDGNIVPVAASPDERHLLLRDEGKSAVHYVNLGAPEENWHVDVPVGRELQLIGDGLFLVGTENGYEERSLVDGSLVSALDTFAGTVAARRLRNGNTLLVGADWQGETGVTLLEIDASGAEQGRVNYSSFNYVRLVRPTPDGTYLMPSDLTIYEGDESGNVVWQASVQDSTEAHAWKALRLPSGETVAATGYEASLQVFDQAGQFVRRLRAPVDTTPNFYSDFQILSNGNYLVANWQGHGEANGNLGHQLVELDDQGNLVWSWQQDASYVSSLQAVILLDGLNLDKLYVEDMTGALVPID